MPRLEAASISITSTDPPAAISLQLEHTPQGWLDRKSTRLNSSHLGISYAVFCLKKKKHGGRGRDPTGRAHVGAHRAAAQLLRGTLRSLGVLPLYLRCRSVLVSYVFFFFF